MYDVFAAILVANHLSRRHRPEQRVNERHPEPDSPWGRIFAWHRRGPTARS